ncbi:major histocompatibility complex class I-related protein 1-like [Stigmatopora nigra]
MKTKMFLHLFVILSWSLLVIKAEIHSLMYIYTGLSKAAQKIPSTHQFTAMGILDGQIIDYYDSEIQKKIPKQPWIQHQMEPKYWEQGSMSRKIKERWFDANVDIVRKRFGHNSSDIHVLQWRHGCYGELLPDGNVVFHSAVDQYSYDGEDFLSFNNTHSEWVAAVKAAEESKRRWDGMELLRTYTHGYLKKECITWIERFLQSKRKHVSTPPAPSVEIFGKMSPSESGTVVLSCHASSFLHKDVSLEIRRDGRTLVREDGVVSTGVRPNHDSTFQSGASVEILQSDCACFTCVLRHSPSDLYVEEIWDGGILGKPCLEVTGAVGVSVGLAVVALCVGLLIWCRLRKCNSGAASKVPTKGTDVELFNSEKVTLKESSQSSQSSKSSKSSKSSLVDSVGSSESRESSESSENMENLLTSGRTMPDDESL